MPPKIKISLATKFSLMFVVIFLVTMISVTYGVRRTIVTQFVNSYEREVNSTLRSTQLDFESKRLAISQQLRELAKKIREDNDFRLHAMVLEDVYNPFLIDYASKYMATMGLQVLEIANESGIVLSSGHARNTFGKQILSLISRLQSFDFEYALAWFEDIDRRFLCLASVETVVLGSQHFFLIGGMEITSEFLASLLDDSTDCVIMELGDSRISSSPEMAGQILSSISSDVNFREQYSVGKFQIPFVDSNSSSQANIYLIHPRTRLTDLLRNLNRQIFTITGIGLFIAILLTAWLSRSVVGPLRRLAMAADDLSLDKLPSRFDLNGNDEVGLLSEAFRGMVKRLRISRIRLAAAERKAVLAEVARQVNHDIKNGFIPIRNVMQHWQEVADNEKEKLVQIFNDRKSTVIESLDYLESLTRSYLRHKPDTILSAVNVNKVVENLLESYRDLGDRQYQILTDFDPGNPYVHADEIQLRRAFENILQNAVEAIESDGRIVVKTSVEDDKVNIIFKDNGSGMPVAALEQLFKPHFTTKQDGTGMGLINVKRILEDFGGSVSIESEAGKGTSVKMRLPRTRM